MFRMMNYTKEVSDKIKGIENANAQTKLLMEYVNQKKDEILLAWLAGHPFSASKAIFIEDKSDQFITKFYIKEKENVVGSNDDVMIGTIGHKEIECLSDYELVCLIRKATYVQEKRLSKFKEGK